MGFLDGFVEQLSKRGEEPAFIIVDEDYAKHYLGIEIMAEFEVKWDNVLVERWKKEDGKTPGGIITLDGASEDVWRGKVVATGMGVMVENGNVIPNQVEAGDLVIFQPDVGHTVMHDGKQYILIKERDVLCVVK